MIVIIDSGIGNLASIQNMLKRIGAEAAVSADPEEIGKASKLILPGVGAFDHGMESLEARGFVELLRRRVLSDRVPILGICLGAQLLTEGSEEGSRKGLGFLKARTVRFRLQGQENLKVPHMGWTDVVPAGTGRLFSGFPDPPRFYFVHSYHFEADDPSDVSARSFYGYEFPSALERGNILAIQFHPEKSHRFGKQLLTNFVNLY